MKLKSVLILALAGFLSIPTFALDKDKVLSGNSDTEFGKYTINKSDKNISIKESNLEVYLLDYEIGEQPVYIAIDHDKNCRNFIVRSKYFEVQYKCRKNNFGVTYMHPKYTTLEPTINSERLNENEFLRQRIITNMEHTDEELLELIASFFPRLLKDNYKKALI